MFHSMFEGTYEDQMRFLTPRSIITIVTVAASLVAYLISGELPTFFAVVMLFAWGWGAIRDWFGITTIGAIFSGNIVIGLLMFVFYLFAAYFVGIIFSVIGVGRWLYLCAAARGR